MTSQRILLTADPELPVPPKLYGGIERIIDLLITGLKSRGHTIGLVAHKDSIAKCDRLFPWWGARSQDKIDMMRNTYTLWQAIREFQPDLVHSYLINNLEEACNAVTILDQINRINCRQRVEQCFSASVIVNKYEELYSHLLNNNNYFPIKSRSQPAGLECDSSLF